jgi:hypothetical protein
MSAIVHVARLREVSDPKRLADTCKRAKSAVIRGRSGTISFSIINTAAGFLLTGLLAACASSVGSPFPSSITFNGSQQFIFTAKGTWAFPANTASGEKGRLDWLNHYLTQNDRCPSGYQIISRTPEPLEFSLKRSAGDQQQRSITYIGQCR